MVFLIQNTQNRDTETIQTKLDELIRSTQGAHNALFDLKALEQETLDASRAKYQAMAAAARRGLRLGREDTGRLNHEPLLRRRLFQRSDLLGVAGIFVQAFRRALADGGGGGGGSLALLFLGAGKVATELHLDHIAAKNPPRGASTLIAILCAVVFAPGLDTRVICYYATGAGKHQ